MQCGGSLSISLISLVRQMCMPILMNSDQRYFVGVVVKNNLAYFLRGVVIAILPVRPICHACIAVIVTVNQSNTAYSE